MRDIKIIKFSPGIAWFFIVLFLMCMPGKTIPSISWFDKIYIDKWVHLGVFCLLALLFMWPIAISQLSNPKKLQYFLRIAIATSIWGLTTEFIQKYLVANRSFDLLDWAADTLGALSAFIFCRMKYLQLSK